MSGDPGNRHYHEKKVRYIRIMYVFAIILWAITIYMLKLYRVDIIGLVILCIPLIIFGVAMYYASDLCTNVEVRLTRANMLSISVVIVIGLLAALEKSYSGKVKLGPAMMAAVIFSLVSMYDLWFPINYISIQSHFKSIMQTYSITLLIFILYRFYRNHQESGDEKNGMSLFSPSHSHSHTDTDTLGVMSSSIIR